LFSGALLVVINHLDNERPNRMWIGWFGR